MNLLNKEVGISIKNLSLSFQQGERQVIFHDLSIEFEKGKTTAIVGKSGIGKSSLLKSIAGLLAFQNGEIHFDGLPLKSKKIAYMPQSYGLLPWETIEKMVRHTKRILNQDIDKDVVNGYLNDLDLIGLTNKYPSQLSGGQKQRLSLFRCLLFSSEVILMDEPFSALDTETKSKAYALFLKNMAQKNKTILFVTHDEKEAEILADHVLELKEEGEAIWQK